jgi:SOS response regulatory protein OraA/RecX
LSQDKANALRAQAVRIRAAVKSSTETIIQVGQDLISVKEAIGHGKFRDWIETECGFSVRSAENYIRAAEFAQGKNATVALLQPATVYRLAAKSAPADIVDAVIQRAEQGDIIPDGDVAAALKVARKEKRAVERSKRAKPLSKGQIARREKQQREFQEEARRRTDAAYDAAISIMAELGTEKARFILRLYYNDRDFDSFEMFSELSKQLGESQ